MAIIAEYTVESCKITVHDDYIIRDPEKVQKIIDNVSRVVLQEELRRAMELHSEETA